MFSNDFKEILDSYKSEKARDFKDSTLVFKITEEIPQIMADYLNDAFTVKASCGQGSWNNYPWINIIDKSFDNLQEALVIEYKFDSENSNIYLSLIPRLIDYSTYKSVRQKLINILKCEFLDDFTIVDDDSYAIISKKYGWDELTNFKIEGDLEYIISLYTKILPYFNSYVNSADDPILHERIIEIDDEFYNQYGVLAEKMCNEISSADLASDIKIKDITFTYPKIDNYTKSINSPEELFKDSVIDEIRLCPVSVGDYKRILIDIKKYYRTNLKNIILMNNIDFNYLSLRDKILLFSKSFTDTSYKSVGKQLGSYAFNEIRIDDRLSNPLIITSIIHELSHFILERIFKEILMKIIDSNDTPLISSFVKIMLEDNDLNYLLDEYCAHSVEGRFALYGYQDYSSFKYKLDEISGLYSKEDIDYALLVANTFAYDIKEIMEDFIDDDLRDDIKEEFLYMPQEQDFAPLDFEIESRFECEELIEAIAIILTSGIGETLNQSEKLARYMEKYSNLN